MTTVAKLGVDIVANSKGTQTALKQTESSFKRTEQSAMRAAKATKAASSATVGLGSRMQKVQEPVSKVGTAVSGLGFAMGGMTGKAGQAVTVVGNLAGVMAATGPFGLAAAGAAIAIGKVTGHFLKAQEAAEKLSDELWNRQVGAINSLIDSIMDLDRELATFGMSSIEKREYDLDEKLKTAERKRDRYAENIETTEKRIAALREESAKQQAAAAEEAARRGAEGGKFAVSVQRRVSTAHDETAKKIERQERALKRLKDKYGGVKVEVQLLHGQEKRLAKLREKMDEAQYRAICELIAENDEDNKRSIKITKEHLSEKIDTHMSYIKESITGMDSTLKGHNSRLRKVEQENERRKGAEELIVKMIIILKLQSNAVLMVLMALSKKHKAFQSKRLSLLSETTSCI